MTPAAQRGRPAAAAGPHRRGLVGLHASVVRSCNRGIVGASGTVVRETRNMLVLLPARARGPAPAGVRPDGRGPYRSYPKAGSVWRLGPAARAGGSGGAGAGGGAPSDPAEIDGSLIARRPEDRLRSGPPAAPRGRRRCRRRRAAGKGGGTPQ